MKDYQSILLEQVKPSVVLGGLSPRDGLDATELSKWCEELGLAVSGVKSELIARIIDYYDELLEKPELDGDERELWYLHFDALAQRDLQFLRSQQLIQKDLECESKFEQATNYLFEKRLGNSPLKMVGTSHADGVLSYRDKVILWDNKSKERPVNLRDHLKQFDSYIWQSEKPVAAFLVIGPSFTEDSRLVAMQYQVEKGTPIVLVEAVALKEIAEAWAAKKQGNEEPFPLGYLIQPGVFNKELVAAI